MMILSTTDSMPGKHYEVLGVARGLTVQSKHIGRDFMAGLKSIVGGELAGYTELLSDAKEEATNRMIEQAKFLGGDAILSVRYITAAVMDGAVEVMAYGTAVKFG